LDCYKSGDIEAAEASYRNALAWDPHNPHLRADLGQVYYERGRVEEAEKQFRKALDYDYQNLDALQRLGFLHQDQGALADAMYFYLRYLEIQPHDANVCLNLGVVFHSMGNYDKAIEYYIRAEKEAPGDPQAAKNHALALIALARFEDAEAILAHAGEVSPEDGEIERLMGDCFLGQGDYQAALDHYQSATQKNPEDAAAHLGFAQVAAQLGGRPESVSHAERAVQLYRQVGDNGGAAAAYWELGWDYYLLGDWSRSLEASTESLQLDPEQVPVRFNRALALLQLGRSSEARQEYLEGIDRLSQEFDLKYHAIDDLSDALQKNPNLAGGAEILAMLEEKYVVLSKHLAESARQSANRARHVSESAPSTS
jgi:superkiller protein 3